MKVFASFIFSVRAWGLQGPGDTILNSIPLNTHELVELSIVSPIFGIVTEVTEKNFVKKPLNSQSMFASTLVIAFYSI